MSVLIFINGYAQEPGCNIGSSLYSMKHNFPNLRYIKTDEKGDLYEDGYSENGIAMFFYFKDNYVVEECMICQSNDDFSLDLYNSFVSSFNDKYYSALKKNTPNEKQYVFSTFNINLIYVSENGKNTVMIVYEKNNTGTSSYSQKNTNQIPQQQAYMTSDQKENIEWYEIDYTENQTSVYGMQSVGFFSATSTPSLFRSRTYQDAFVSALNKIKKKAAKRGVRRLLITYKSSMDWDFLTVKVEAIGYK